jgi:hypothetical protein
MFDNWKQENMNHNQLDGGCDVALCYYLKKKGCRFIVEDKLFYCCNYIGRQNDGKINRECKYHKYLKIDIISCHDMSLCDFDDFTTILNCI